MTTYNDLLENMTKHEAISLADQAVRDGWGFLMYRDYVYCGRHVWAVGLRDYRSGLPFTIHTLHEYRELMGRVGQPQNP